MGAMLRTALILRLAVRSEWTVALCLEFGFPMKILIPCTLPLTVCWVVVLVVTRVVHGADPCEFPNLIRFDDD